jgi:hypothetical protein
MRPPTEAEAKEIAWQIEKHKRREDINNRSVKRDPSETKLAEPAPDCGALQFSNTVAKAIDEAMVHIVNDLDDLIGEIEQIKQTVITDGAAVKAAVAGHFELGAEALAFRDVVRRRLMRLPEKANGHGEVSQDAGPQPQQPIHGPDRTAPATLPRATQLRPPRNAGPGGG